MSGLRDNRFAIAARYNDALAEEWGDAVLTRFGVTAAEVVPVARQRALRIHLLNTGRGPELRAAYDRGRPHKFTLSRNDEAMIQKYSVAVLDAILIGLRAQLAESDST